MSSGQGGVTRRQGDAFPPVDQPQAHNGCHMHPDPVEGCVRCRNLCDNRDQNATPAPPTSTPELQWIPTVLMLPGDPVHSLGSDGHPICSVAPLRRVVRWVPATSMPTPSTRGDGDGESPLQQKQQQHPQTGAGNGFFINGLVPDLLHLIPCGLPTLKVRT